MNPILREILASKIVRDSNGQEYELRAHVSEDVGVTISDVIRSMRPIVSLEVGLAQGISSLFICEALAEIGATKHYIIDPNQTAEWKNIGISNLRSCGYGNLVELREEMSHIALPRLLNEGVKIDFAFVDGWHVFDQVIVDFFYIDKILNIGGVIAFDDSVWPSVQKALRFILRNRHYVPVGNTQSFRSRFDALATFMRPVSSRLDTFLRPEFIEPNGTIGISPGSRCIVMQKKADDDRNITFHYAF